MKSSVGESVGLGLSGGAKKSRKGLSESTGLLDAG